MTGLNDFDGDREFPPDHEGSAKVALVGMDRSLAAWDDLVSLGVVDARVAAPFRTDLLWLRHAVEGLVPTARTFVRPGFDELDEVRILDAAER